MRALVASMLLAAPAEADLRAMEREMRALFQRYGVEFVVKDSGIVQKNATLREIVTLEASKT